MAVRRRVMVLILWLPASAVMYSATVEGSAGQAIRCSVAHQASKCFQSERKARSVLAAVAMAAKRSASSTNFLKWSLSTAGFAGVAGTRSVRVGEEGVMLNCSDTL